MTTELEHIAADWAKMVADYGTDHVIDGETVRCLVTPEQREPSEFVRGIVVSKKIYHLVGAMETRLPDQVVTIDVVRWTVIGHELFRFAACLSLMRVSG